MMTTDQKGAIAEMAITLAALKLGVDVYRPVAEGGRYDLVMGVESTLIRVQCKWAVRRGGVVVVRCYSCRRTRAGMVRRAYTPDQIDAFAAYCLELDRCWFLPIELFPYSSAIQLRLSPTRNNQQLKINWADEFEFAARLGRLGAVAQLGERLAGSQKVRGSNPLGSIGFDPAAVGIGGDDESLPGRTQLLDLDT